MKQIISILGFLIFSFLFINCDDDVEELNPDDLLGESVITPEEGIENPTTNPDTEFSVTANINGTNTVFFAPTGQSKAQSLALGAENVIILNVFDNQNISETIFSLSIVINRNNLRVGETELGFGSGVGTITGLNLINLATSTSFSAVSGQLTIETVDTTQGIASGSFEAEFNESTPGSTNVVRVTNGSFRFAYDVQ